MDVMLVAVAAVTVIIAVSALAPKAGVAAPLILVLIGVGVSFLPAVPALEIEPEIILAGVLPALLYAAAASFPSMDFRRDFAAISGLSVLLVVASAVVMGLIFAWMIPGLDLAAGIALGAIVSPTDAVATSIIKKLGAPARVVTVLNGEGLLNDATSLVLLRTAVAATAASVSFWSIVGDFLWAVGLAVVSGVVVGLVGLRVRRRLGTPVLSTAVSFVVPFAAYWPAEALEASGIVASVTAGLVTGTLSAHYLTPQVRTAEKLNWRTLEGLLEGALFLVMGLELFALVSDVEDEGGSLSLALGVAAVAAVGVVVIRAAFILPLLRTLAHHRQRGAQRRDVYVTMQDRLEERLSAHDPATTLTATEAVDALQGAWPDEDQERRREVLERRAQRHGGRIPRRRPPIDDPRRRARILDRIDQFRRRLTRRIADIDYLAAAPLGPKEGVVLVWAGMRGVVTLAAAQTLPADFPQRSLLVLVAFGVAAGTLLVQGGTLPWVVRRLGLAGVEVPHAADHAAGLRTVMHDAAAELLAGDGPARADGTRYAPEVLERSLRVVAKRESEQDEDAARSADLTAQIGELRVRIIEEQREALLRARADGTFDSSLLAQMLDQLDAEQIAVEMRGDAP